MRTETGVFEPILESAANLPAPKLLQELRQRGREGFAALGLPNRRQEEWRFTRLKGIEDEIFAAPDVVAASIDISPGFVARTAEVPCPVGFWT